MIHQAEKLEHKMLQLPLHPRGLPSFIGHRCDVVKKISGRVWCICVKKKICIYVACIYIYYHIYGGFLSHGKKPQFSSVLFSDSQVVPRSKP